VKVHAVADVSSRTANSGTVHTVSVTPANAADIGALPNPLREDDRAVFGDAA